MLNFLFDNNGNNSYYIMNAIAILLRHRYSHKTIEYAGHRGINAIQLTYIKCCKCHIVEHTSQCIDIMSKELLAREGAKKNGRWITKKHT